MRVKYSATIVSLIVFLTSSGELAILILVEIIVPRNETVTPDKVCDFKYHNKENKDYLV